MKIVSIVIPVYNEQEVLPELQRRLCEVIDPIEGYAFEVVLVDDASTDDTPRIIADLNAADPRFKTVRFSRNFGSHTAIRAGIDHCTGDYACIMAADLQDPPELIPDLLAKMAEGYNTVWAYREGRKDPLLKRITSGIYNFVIYKLGMPAPGRHGADVVAFDRKIIDKLRGALREKDSNLFVLIRWAGFRQTGFGYAKQARAAGESGFSTAKRLKIAIDAFVAFSFFPIRLISYLGLSVAFVGFIYAAYLVAYRLISGNMISGFATIMTAILVLSGIQMIMLGVVAEYLWRTFNASRDRPLYLVEDTKGFDAPSEGDKR